ALVLLQPGAEEPAHESPGSSERLRALDRVRRNADRLGAAIRQFLCRRVHTARRRCAAERRRSRAKPQFPRVSNDRFQWRNDPQLAIFRGSFKGSGANAGPVVLGGVRFPIGPMAIGGEIRYQSAKGTLPADQDFAGNTIDLGGFNYLLVFNVRF